MRSVSFRDWLCVFFFFFAQNQFLEVCPNYYINNTSFLLIAEWGSMVWMDHSLFNQLSIDKLLSYFLFRVIRAE